MSTRSSTQLLVGSNHEALLRWCEDRIGNGTVFTPETSRAVALLDAENDYEPIVVAVMDGWRVNHCEVSMASDGTRRWQNDEFKDAVYSYIFDINGKHRMNLIIRVDNDAANKCQERLGHTREARMRDWFGPDEDAFLWAYTRQEWLLAKAKAACSVNTIAEERT